MAISGMVVGRKKPSAPRAISTSLPVSCGAEIVDPVLRRGTNAELRTREYLTPAEIEELIKAAKDGRWAHRDATLILVAYRHGLRAKEACELEWSQVEFGRSACLHVRRAKNGKPSVHPMRGDELRMLTQLRKENPDSGYVFNTERGTPFTADAINRLVKPRRQG